MATPHAVLNHARHPLHPDPTTDRPRIQRRTRRRSGLLIGATAALAFAALPGTAGAEPGTGTGTATSAEQATQLVAEASHELEVVTEELNTAKVLLEQQQAAVAAAEKDVAGAEERLAALDDQIRELARIAYTGDGLSELNVLMSSGSAEEFVSQLGTLDVIAGHTNDVLAEVAAASEAAEKAREKADEETEKAQKAVDEIAAQQTELESHIADYQRQYDALTAPQQQEVVEAHGGTAVAVTPLAAPASGAAGVAVNTALAQVGDPYVWGAGGPDSFDCSGLMQYAYAAAGISLPHSSQMQSRMGAAVSPSALQPGDMLFFYSPVSHVGMYIGNGQMVHASTSGSPVKVVEIEYMMDDFSGARRVA